MFDINKSINERLDEIDNLYSQLMQVCIECGEPLKNKNVHHHDKKEYELYIENLRELRMACILDSFSLKCYSSECILIELTPYCWQEQIDEFRPHIVFIESAWDGKNGLWHDKIVKSSEEYLLMTNYCHDKHIPVVFWNKEDPVWTEQFMLAAGQADIVFTTDIDCIENYKKQLGNDNVFLLHFAAQPKIHNPIEKYERLDKICFAGAYYHRYPERCAVFDSFSEIFEKEKGLDIYDRNYKTARPEHMFLKKYNKNIIGRLESEEIDKAYKGYEFGLNMNSVTQSQSMFARRVFELLASNTLTIGNYSRGVKNFFGDLTISTDSADRMFEKLIQYSNNKLTFQKYKLLGLRRVLQEHLYEDRLSYIVKMVFGKFFQPRLPEINVISKVNNLNEYNRIIKMYKRQSYHKGQLFLIFDDEIQEEADDYVVLSSNDAQKNLGLYCADDSYIAVFDSCDYYGDNYLMDLALTTRYIDADIIGKDMFYQCDNGQITCVDGEKYHFCNSISSSCSMSKVSFQKQKSILDILSSDFIGNENAFSIDEFNYCKNYVGETCSVVDDLVIEDQGIPMERMNHLAEQIQCIGQQETRISGFISRSNVLVLTNHYPAYDNLYRNMFVHKRVQKYCQNGALCDVMQMNLYARDGVFREFEDINIIEGKSSELASILETGQIDTVCVHFMDAMMWEVLKNYLKKLRIIIWCHGSDIQPHHRRAFLYKTEEEIKKAKEQTMEKQRLWKDIFVSSEVNNIQFVFVSQYFADIVMEDYQYRFYGNQYHIIHNCIDTELFSYCEKSVEQRKKIVSIRPYSSEIYGNDLMVSTILELAKRPFFKELEFMIIGDGELFTKTVKPLKKYKNVKIKKGFLRQHEIAQIYQEYGVVLIPSRGDTQGVSRDEAMSCGLVPITNAVTAIPEFVDEKCGFLANQEDYVQMANDIEWIYYHEEQYHLLSENATKRVRDNSSEKYTIQRELELIENVKNRD